MARKKKGLEAHENSDRWLLTYADMITLLMAFFIMMYSMSVMNLAKFREAAFSIRSGFNGMMKSGGKHLMEQHVEVGPSIRQHLADAQSLQNIQRQLNQVVDKKKIDNVMQISQDTRGIIITIVADGILFKQGSAELTIGASRFLDQVVTAIKPLRNDILVEGHTCMNPIHTVIFPSNWELSAVRASRVVRYFAEHDIADGRLVAVGYGSTRPRAPNDTEAHRALNRRVNIIIVNASFGPTDNLPLLSKGYDSAPRFLGVKPDIRKVWSVPDSAEEGGQQ